VKQNTDYKISEIVVYFPSINAFLCGIKRGHKSLIKEHNHLMLLLQIGITQDVLIS